MADNWKCHMCRSVAILFHSNCASSQRCLIYKQMFHRTAYLVLNITNDKIFDTRSVDRVVLKRFTQTSSPAI